MKRVFGRLDHHIKELLSGAALALTVKSGAALVSIILGIVLGRLLGPDGAGLYYTTVTIVTIASTLGCVGLNNSLVRFIAANKVAGDLSAVRGVYRWATLIASVVSLLIGASVSLGSQWLANDIYRIPELARPLFWAGWAIPACTLIIIHAQALQGLKRVTASMAVLSLYAPTVSVILILFLAPSLGALGAVAAFVIAAYFTIALGLWHWRSAAPYSADVKGHFPLRKLLRSGSALAIAAMMGQVTRWSSIVLLGIMGTASDVGIFGSADRLAKLLSFVLMATNSIAAPKFSELYRQRQFGTLQNVARRAAMLQVFVGAPLLMAFVLYPEEILGVFGEEFSVGAPVLVALAVGQFVNTACGSVGYLLMMSGNEVMLRNNLVFCAFLGVFLNISWIPEYGVVGAAWATSITISSSNLISTWMVWRKMRILPLPIPAKWLKIPPR